MSFEPDRDGCPVEVKTLYVERATAHEKLDDQKKWGWKLYDWELGSSPYDMILVLWRPRQ